MLYAHVSDMLFVARRMVRSQIVFANTMFKAVCYNHEENQVITGGTDRKVITVHWLVLSFLNSLA